jgi:hypothetical protein
MPRTVPTQVIALIDQNFPDLTFPNFVMNHATGTIGISLPDPPDLIGVPA